VLQDQADVEFEYTDKHPFYKTNRTMEIPMAKTAKTGLEALLRPQDSILVLIDLCFAKKVRSVVTDTCWSLKVPQTLLLCEMGLWATVISQSDLKHAKALGGVSVT
jgi:hypothetical protein